MGNDGGSIPKRDDLVKTKRYRTGDGDAKARLRILFSTCSLSKEPLRAPVVSCPLGKLYNKEAVISYLLDPGSKGEDASSVAGHLRSLKDLTTLVLTPNPNSSSYPSSTSTYSTHDGDDSVGSSAAAAIQGGTQEVEPPAAFVCPISLREMNGSVKFVYRKPGGAVISESALKELRRNIAADDEDALSTCPVTGVKYEGVKEEWVTINPVGKEEEDMKEAWRELVKREKEEKRLAKESKKKRRNGDGDEPAKEDSKKSSIKKQKIEPAALTSIPALSAASTLAAKLAEEKKKTISPAIASLYAPKDDGTNKDRDGRSNWMTRGAFTRYA